MTTGETVSISPMLIVPTDTAGISTREIGLMNDPDHRNPVWSHCEVGYDEVRVPSENLLGTRGQTFQLAQKRLGPGRAIVAWASAQGRSVPDIAHLLDASADYARDVI